MNRGDVRLGQTVDFWFTTVNTAGVPTTLAGTPAIAAYVDDGDTEITAGITLTVDKDGRTGFNHVRAVLSGANGYAAGTALGFTITAGTVGGGSVVGYVVAEYSIQHRSIVVDADGVASANLTKILGTLLTETAGLIAAGFKKFFNVASPTGTVNSLADAVPGAAGGGLIAGANAATTVDITGNITGNLSGSVGSVGTGGISAASIADGALTAAKFAAGAFDAVWSVATRTLTSFGSLVSDTATAVAAALDAALDAIFGAADAAATAAAAAAADTAVMRPIIETNLDVVLSSRAASGVQDANLVQVDGDADTVERLKRVTDSEVLGTCGVGGTTTSIVTSSLVPAAVAVDQFKGRIVLFDRATTTAALRGQGTRITGSSALGVLTVEALSTAPASGDTFTIV